MIPRIAIYFVSKFIFQVSDVDSYVVNPRNPQRRTYRKSPNFQQAGRRQSRDQDELFNFSDQFNQYYQSFQNHRVKRHEQEMKKSNVGEVKTNSTFQVRKLF